MRSFYRIGERSQGYCFRALAAMPLDSEGLGQAPISEIWGRLCQTVARALHRLCTEKMRNVHEHTLNPRLNTLERFANIFVKIRQHFYEKFAYILIWAVDVWHILEAILMRYARSHRPASAVSPLDPRVAERPRPFKDRIDLSSIWNGIENSQLCVIETAASLPFFSWLMSPILLSTDASTELFELHSLLVCDPIFPRSAWERSRLLLPLLNRWPLLYILLVLDELYLIGFVDDDTPLSADGMGWKPPTFTDWLNPPYFAIWPLCKLIDCCNFNRLRISSSESELEFSW